jgi:hypothetical protein
VRTAGRGEEKEKGGGRQSSHLLVLGVSEKLHDSLLVRRESSDLLAHTPQRQMNMHKHHDTKSKARCTVSMPSLNEIRSLPRLSSLALSL